MTVVASDCRHQRDSSLCFIFQMVYLGNLGLVHIFHKDVDVVFLCWFSHQINRPGGQRGADFGGSRGAGFYWGPGVGLKQYRYSLFSNKFKNETAGA